MKLTIVHDGNPANVRIVNAETGVILEDVVSYRLERPGYHPHELLTVTVNLPGFRRSATSSPWSTNGQEKSQ